MKVVRKCFIISFFMCILASVACYGQRVVKRQNTVTKSNSKNGVSTPKNNRSQAKVKIDWIEIDDFHEGLAIVRDANNKYGFIDKTGKVVK